MAKSASSIRYLLHINPIPIYVHICIAGHKFEVRYNSKDYEFRYKPIEVASTVKDSDELASSLAVPDYMLPKFLMMLLNKTYQATPEQSETIIVSESDDD